MVPGLKNMPYEQRLIQLHLWTLEERRVRADLIEVYKMMNGTLVFTLIASLNTTPTEGEEHVGTSGNYAKRGLTRI